MTKVQSFPLLRTALSGESGDEAATPLSFPHINQDEANQAKFNRKEHCQGGWSYLPCAQPGSRLCSGLWSSSRGKGWGMILSTSLWTSAWAGSGPKQQFRTHLREIKASPTWQSEEERREEREREWGRKERKEQRKNKKSGRVKEGEGPLNVTSPALWNGFSLMLTTWYLLSI